jgi:hypothetical protein
MLNDADPKAACAYRSRTPLSLWSRSSGASDETFALIIVHHAHRCAWLSPTGRQIRSPLMRCLLWPLILSAPSHTHSPWPASLSTITRVQRHLRWTIASRGDAHWPPLDPLSVLDIRTARLGRGTLRPTFVSDLRAHISEAAGVSHALASAACTHISPRTSATPLLRPQHEPFWSALLMPRPLRLTYHLRNVPTPMRTSPGRVGAGGTPCERSAGRVSNFPMLFDYINTTHLPTHTRDTHLLVQSSVPSEFQPQYEPAALAVPQSAHSLHTMKPPHRQQPRSPIAPFSLKYPTPPSRITSTPSELRRNSARTSAASQHDQHSRSYISRTPRQRISATIDLRYNSALARVRSEYPQPLKARPHPTLE